MSGVWTSERLSYGKEELKVTDTLRHAGTCQGSAALQQLRGRSLKSHEGRRIDGVREVEADGTDRGAVADTESDRMHGIVEVLVVELMEAERDVAEGRVHISHVVKQYALNVLADEGEAQLDIVKEQGIAAQREAGGLSGRAARHQGSARI